MTGGSGRQATARTVATPERLWRLSRRVAVLSLVTLVAGCGGQATVSGRVTYGGNPLRHGSVIFLAEDGTARSGAIGDDGTYQVAGVKPGEARVGVISPKVDARHVPNAPRSDVAAKKKAATTKEKSTIIGWVDVPKQFENPATSGVRVVIGRGTVTQDIELK